jgi:hypothetical protein
MKATVSPGESIGTLFAMPPLNIRFVLLCAYATWVVDGVADASAVKSTPSGGGGGDGGGMPGAGPPGGEEGGGGGGGVAGGGDGGGGDGWSHRGSARGEKPAKKTLRPLVQHPDMAKRTLKELTPSSLSMSAQFFCSVVSASGEVGLGTSNPA